MADGGGGGGDDDKESNYKVHILLFCVTRSSPFATFFLIHLQLFPLPAVGF